LVILNGLDLLFFIVLDVRLRFPPIHNHSNLFHFSSETTSSPHFQSMFESLMDGFKLYQQELRALASLTFPSSTPQSKFLTSS
jgi:hypothetical protein